MRTLINAAGLVLVLAALVTFCVLNIGSAELIMPVLNDWRVERMALPLPLCVLILVPLGCGVILGSLLDALKIYQLKREVRTLRKEAQALVTQAQSESNSLP